MLEQEIESIEKRIMELRMLEIDTREKLIEELRRAESTSFFRSMGRSSLREFCLLDLGYDEFETRALLVKLGHVLPSAALRSDDPATQQRIDRLKTWRRAAASREGIAAFRVITNRSLLEVAKANPSVPDELLKTPGIGQKKLMSYGNEILHILNS